MALEIDIDGAGGAGFFTPDDHVHAVAFAIEAKNFRADVPNPKYGNTRNITTADVTIFRNMDELQGNGDPLVLERVQITQTYLALDLEPFIGKVAVRKLAKVAGAPGQNPSWKWRKLDIAVAELVVAYLEKREAALEDVELPSF